MQEVIIQCDLYGQIMIFFFDEIYWFMKVQQDVLLFGVENGWVILIVVIMENLLFLVILLLLLCLLLLIFQLFIDDDIGVFVDWVVVDVCGFGGVVMFSDEVWLVFIWFVLGDVRCVFIGFEVGVVVVLLYVVVEIDEVVVLGVIFEVFVDDVVQVVDKVLLCYDWQGDEYYDVISVFIKFIWGLDLDVVLYYFVCMIEVGEDLCFIVWCLVIFVFEDVGFVDFQVFGIVVVVVDVVVFIGMLEGWILFVEVMVYFVMMVKFNVVYVGIDVVIVDICVGGFGCVLLYLCDVYYLGVKWFGYGCGYCYLYDSEYGIVLQQYLLDEFDGKYYYEFKNFGVECDIVVWLECICWIFGDC